MWGIGFLIAVYCGLFFLQKIIVIYAERKISKFVPIMILAALGIIGYIAYLFELWRIKNKTLYISMELDITDWIFLAYEAIILIAVFICIVGFIYGTYCKWRMKKNSAEQQKNKFQIRL